MQFRLLLAAWVAMGWAASAVGADRPFLGVRLAPEAVIDHVFPESPAEKAGLQSGDVLKKIGDHEVTSTEDFQAELRTYKPNAEVVIDITRDGDAMTLKPVLTQLSVKWVLSQKDPPRVAGGTIQLGGGTIGGDFTNVGNMVFEGPSRIEGSFTQEWSGVLDLAIADTEAPPPLSIAGKANLAGLLHVRFKGVEPKIGDKFELVTSSGGMEGRFEELSLPKLDDKRACIIKYDALAEGRDLDGDGKSDVTLYIVDADTVMPEVE